jgi:hypothetical protein
MAKSFDLNDSSYDAKDVVIFNDGEPGIAEDLSVKVIKATAEEKAENSNSPDYKVLFTDKNGGQINLGYWYPKEDESDDNVIRFLKRLKHLAHCFLGADAQLPKGNPRQILDGVMKAIKDIAAKTPVRIYTNYGTNGYEKKYLTVRSFVPFIEPMSVKIEDTRLRASNIENMIRPTADETSGGGSSTGTSAQTKDEDWD